MEKLGNLSKMIGQFLFFFFQSSSSQEKKNLVKCSVYNINMFVLYFIKNEKAGALFQS
jgi:hypothetical protein